MSNIKWVIHSNFETFFAGNYADKLHMTHYIDDAMRFSSKAEAMYVRLNVQRKAPPGSLGIVKVAFPIRTTLTR